MLTLAEADLIICILSTLFVLMLLTAFMGALFLEKHRSKLAILAGMMAGLLLVMMVMALAAPYIFPS